MEQSYLSNNNNSFLVSPNTIGNITFAALNIQISTVVSSIVGDIPTILDVNNNTLCISTILPCPYDNNTVTISSPITVIDSNECTIGLQFNSITTINSLSIVQGINTPQMKVDNNFSSNTAIISSLTVSSINNIPYLQGTSIQNKVTYITTQSVTYTINDLIQQGNIYMNMNHDSDPANTVITVNLPVLPTDNSLDGYVFTFRKLVGGVDEANPNWTFNGSIIPINSTLNNPAVNTYSVNNFNITYTIVTYNSIGYYIASI
jgi:hypothetical protein